MMWSLRRAIAVIGAVAVLTGANVARADGPAPGSGRIVTPDREFAGWTGGELIGEGWYTELSLPAEINPAFGNGEQCIKLGPNAAILLAIGTAPLRCTVKAGTAVFVIGITTFCDDVEPPPFFAVGEAAQRDCSWELLKADTTSVRVSVDGGPVTNLQTRRYEACSPLREVQLLEDNFLGVDPQLATFTACGWVAWLVDLSVGVHTLSSVATFVDGSQHVYDPVIKVVRGR